MVPFQYCMRWLRWINIQFTSLIYRSAVGPVRSNEILSDPQSLPQVTSLYSRYTAPQLHKQSSLILICHTWYIWLCIIIFSWFLWSVGPPTYDQATAPFLPSPADPFTWQVGADSAAKSAMESLLGQSLAQTKAWLACLLSNCSLSFCCSF